jgi:protein disulfide-isomerase A6
LFCDIQVKALLRDRLDGKASSGKTSGGSSEKKTEKSESVELNSSNFDELVIKSKDLWIVEFFAPWYVAQYLYCSSCYLIL